VWATRVGQSGAALGDAVRGAARGRPAQGGPPQLGDGRWKKVGKWITIGPM
jgi:hypothetical protein